MRRRRRVESLPPFTSIDAIPLFLTRLDMARALNISVRTLRRQIQAGTVPGPSRRHPDRWRKADVLADLVPVDTRGALRVSRLSDVSRSA